MKHELPSLPYSLNALEPHISAETLKFHYDKHHRGYVSKLNELILGTPFENFALEDIVTTATEGPVFNNAAQHWNHTFLWNCLSPNDLRPQGPLLAAIVRDFGSFELFQKKFFDLSMSQFGSGWSWLVKNDANSKLTVETTSNAKNPLRKGFTPLLTCDVWEHAYYIDYRNERGKYLTGLQSVLNWEFASKNFLKRKIQAAA